MFSPGRARRATVLLALAAAALLVANVLRYASYDQDDSYISLRYARNLALGHGLVFNPGERVEGYTNLLYVLVGALFLRLGIEPIAALKAVGALSALATLALAAFLERRIRGDESSGWLTVVLLAPLEAFVYWAFCPLETALYTALLVAGVAALVARRDVLAVFLFVLLSLTRPEGPFHLAVVLAGLAFVESKEGGFRSLGRPLRLFALVAVLLVPLVLWRHAYYGAWLPNTFYAKVTGGKGALLAGLVYLRDTALAFPLVLLASVVAFAQGLPRPTSEERRLAFPLSLLVLAQLAYGVAIGGDALPFFRFVLPVLPFGCVLLARWLTSRATSLALVPAGAALHLVLSLLTGQPYRAFGADRDGVAGQRAGVHLKSRLPEGSRVAVNPAGALPYFSGLPAVDMLGLNDAAIAHRPHFIESSDWIWSGHRRGWGAYVLSRRPSVILFSGGAGSHQPYYLGDYELADDYRFRFFYRPKTTRLPARDPEKVLARFFRFPYGDAAEGERTFNDVGIVTHLHHGLVPYTVVTEGDLLVRTFEREDRDLSLFEAAADPRGPATLVAGAVALWTDEATRRPPPDAAMRARVETLCDEGYRRLLAKDRDGASALFHAAAEANERALSPRVPRYLANLAVLDGDLFGAVAAQKEALRLDPRNALYRSNLERLLGVTYGAFVENANRHNPRS